MTEAFQTGMETLLREKADWLRGARVGLLAHPASVNAGGVHSAELLQAAPEGRLAALYGAEHGFWGRGGAGEHVDHDRHPEWNLPIRSLYGETRRPTPALLEDIDLLVFDLQTLAARCYTYGTTLRYLLEAAAALGKTLVVADRPVPLANVCDGPLLDPGLESFVAGLPAPLAYGMTPGETALWLKDELALDVDLRVASMKGYTRDDQPRADWPPWVPPSPAIRCWDCAQCYLATVFCEALPALTCGRAGDRPFCLLGAPWLNGAAFAARMESCLLPGVRFAPCVYVQGDDRAEGVRLDVTDPGLFRPVATGVTLLCALQAMYDEEAIWAYPGTREGFFDSLMGTASVREQIREPRPAAAIVGAWQPDLQRFRARREKFLLYPEA